VAIATLMIAAGTVSGALAAPSCGTDPVVLNAYFETGFPLPTELSKEFTKQFPNVTFNIKEDLFATLMENSPRVLAGDNPPDLIRLPSISDLVKDGLLNRKHGSGTFVMKPVSRLQQPLSRLTSFTEDMARRGYVTRSEWLARGLFHPSSDEMMMLGLKVDMMVARLERLRIANELPLAIERASLASDILPDPKAVDASLYAELHRTGYKPVRAVQRISACNVTREDAALLAVPEGSAGLAIERIS
jgi:hypothetical protein